MSPAGSCAVCQSWGGERSLLSGQALHNACYEGLLAKVDVLKAAIQKYEFEIAEAKRALAAAASLTNRIAGWFGAKRIDEKQWEQKARTTSERLEAVAYVHTEKLQQLRALYDVWPTYPPDWDERRGEALRAAPKCEKCSASRNLHVHHRHYIRRGGSHRPENLQVLCGRCHSDQHGGARIGIGATGEAEDSAFSKRVTKIRDAIGAGVDITFKYTKFDGSVTKRRITPKTLEHLGKSLCVAGYCHKRKDGRTFAIHRMAYVKVIDADK